MVIRTFILTLLTSPLLASQVGPLRLPPPSKVRCDAQYAVEMQSILNQFSGFTDKKMLQKYQDFMVWVKQHEDLGYLGRPFERKLTSDQRALIRTPMQKYNDCRTGIGATFGYGIAQQSPSKALLSPCEIIYAQEGQLLLNRVRGNPTATDDIESYLILHKQFEDLAFQISDFEKKTEATTVAKLRSPMRRYENCKDAILRGTLPPPSALPQR